MSSLPKQNRPLELDLNISEKEAEIQAKYASNTQKSSTNNITKGSFSSTEGMHEMPRFGSLA